MSFIHVISWYIANIKCSIADWAHNVHVLGFSLGTRYWRIQRLAKKDPWISIQWAAAAEDEAKRLLKTGDSPELASAYLSWAEELRLAHRRFMETTYRK